jgi:hypothetical protein
MSIKLYGTLSLSEAEYALLHGKTVNIEEFLKYWDVGFDNEGDALSACPTRVRAAIVYHFLWATMLYSRDRIITQMAFAHEAANSTPNSTFSVSEARPIEGGYAKDICVRSAGKGYVNKFLNGLARFQNSRQLRGPNANKVDFDHPPYGIERSGDAPSSVVTGPFHEADYIAGQVAEVSHNNTYWLEKYYVRPKAALVREFAEIVRPLFYPRLHHGFTFLSQNPTILNTGIEYPKSRKQRSRIPISLHHAMEEIVQFGSDGWLQGGICRTLVNGGGLQAINKEIEAYRKAREDYAYGVLCKQANLPDALNQYDQFAEIGYLTPRVVARRQLLDHGMICFPGMNGERVAEQQPQETK